MRLKIPPKGTSPKVEGAEIPRISDKAPVARYTRTRAVLRHGHAPKAERICVRGDSQTGCPQGWK